MIRLFLTLLGYITFNSVLNAQLLITEILFNPSKDGFDYVEGLNSSANTLNLADYTVANRKVTGQVNGAKPMSREPLLVAPGAYFVLTANSAWLRQEYGLNDSIIVSQVTLPSFNDDEGTVIFLNGVGLVIDEVHYSDDWHFELLSEHEGVSLERISLSDSTQNKNNWTSAASSRFGTPGFRNSHFRELSGAGGLLLIQPRLFSPNNDGIEDFTSIRINVDQVGWVVNLRIYDMAGRCIKHLLKNEILGATNDYKWFGLDERSRPLATGIYIVFAELFNSVGETKRYKTTVVLSNGQL